MVYSIAVYIFVILLLSNAALYWLPVDVFMYYARMCIADWQVAR